MASVQHNNGGRNPRILIALVVVIAALGLAYQFRTMAKKPPTFGDDSSVPAAASLGAAPPDVQKSGEQTVQTFLDDLHRQDYYQALKETAGDFPVPHSAAALKSFAERAVFSPILGTPLSFQSAHLGSHGQKLILRASFQADGKPYRTVCSLKNEHGVWLISSVLDPVPPSAPPSSETSGSSKSQSH